jgi:branched-chain amino acid transport system ATP-binding protein
MLELRDIETYYGETQILYGISLRVQRGEVVSLLGANGAGKTTTLRSILGLTPAQRGSIRFDGREITTAETYRIARAGISWVPDDRRVFPGLSVERNLAIARKPSKFRSWSLSDVCELFSPLRYLMTRDCETLSGGEMQMVAISRALLGGPGLVLFDEPTQGLAPKVAQDVMQTILRLREEGIAVLLVEQNTRSALSVSQRVYVIDRGRSIYDGDSAALLHDEALRRRLLGA